MTTAVIIDIIAAAALALFCVQGARRGLLKSLAGLLCVLIALALAREVSVRLTEPAMNSIYPILESQVEKRIDAVLPDINQQSEVLDILDKLGFNRSLSIDMAERVEQTIREKGGSVIMALVDNIARTGVFSILYLISFILIRFALSIFVPLLDDLLSKLPVLDEVNALGGGILGFIEGVMVIFFVAWFLQNFNVWFGDLPLADTQLLKLTAKYSPLQFLPQIQDWFSLHELP